MSPKHKIAAIRLQQKTERNPSYAASIGIEINKIHKKEKSECSK